MLLPAFGRPPVVRAARNQPFDLAIGEGGVREGSLAFGIGPEDHEAVEPPARVRSVGQIGFT